MYLYIYDYSDYVRKNQCDHTTKTVLYNKPLNLKNKFVISELLLLNCFKSEE